MPLIQITPENIHVQARKIRSYRQEQQEIISRLQKLVYSLNDSWKGEAQDAFVAKFKSMETVYRKFSDVLEQYAKLMDKAADDFSREDQNAKSMIRNI